MDDKQLLGSQTAKNGFKNEQDIADKFINWKFDLDAQKWLKIMNYELTNIENIDANILPNKYKSDIQVKISIYLKTAISAENISIKLVSNKKGFNQIDKRWIDTYKEMWNIPNDIVKLLRYHTGELLPYISNPKDKRRMYITEFDLEDQNKVINFFEQNKIMIVTDLLKGRGRLSAEWFMVAQKSDQHRWILKPISVVLNFFGNGPVEITKPKNGNIKIGRIKMQRKGGDNGRKSAQMLQFKLDPTELFNL